ncbi:RNA polymerase sigma factor [Chitinophaga sp. SYP-B3965]|uniref:RNA polymerase sigma factor n=1 Tax=Chitinophaga sp. SYP-B3965 TaxID=2663120 RepID=UPI0015650B6F|nr:sigma-70 family RNA polymerase sigma factor [Chitinophaga sp. SYP-B3965]
MRDLFKRWQQGDEKAFREIFDTYWHSVFTILAQLTGSEADAEELAQDIFCSLWERKDLLLLQGELSHYLHRAAKIKAMQYHRNNSRRNAISVIEPGIAISSPLQYKELEIDLSQAIDLLKEPAREIFLLSHSRQLTQKEIAERTGVSVSMIKYHMTHTRHLLKKKLKHHL